MPTYEYECTQCGAVTELFQSITERPKRRLDCTVCGGPTPVRRLLGSGGAIVFKGGGFYATDYRSESYKKAAQADQPASEKKSGPDKSSPTAQDGKSPASAGETPAAGRKPSTSGEQ